MSGHLLSDLGGPRTFGRQRRHHRQDREGLQGLRDGARSTACSGDLLQAIEGAGLPASQVANFIIRGKRVDAQSSADAPLASLGVTNNSTVMLVRRTEGEIAAARAMAAQEERARRLADVEAAAKLLTQREGGIGNYELSLTDQNGRPISMPAPSTARALPGLLAPRQGPRAQLDNASRRVPPPGAATAASAVDGGGARGALRGAALPGGGRACARIVRGSGLPSETTPLSSIWTALGPPCSHHAHGGGGGGAVSGGGGGDVLAKQRERLEQARQLLSALHGAELQRLSRPTRRSCARACGCRHDAHSRMRNAAQFGAQFDALSTAPPLLCCSSSRVWSRTSSGEFDDARSLLGKAAALRRGSCSTAPKTTPSWRASLIWVWVARGQGVARARARRTCRRAAAHALEKRAEADPVEGASD